MKLLEMLMNSMASDSSVEALSNKAGASKKQTSSLLSLALPILINHMTQNASTQSGVQSLANALTQHTDTSSMVQQIENADEQDGNAIIQHILGSDSPQVVGSLSQQTGMSNDQVMSLLGNMAPGMLSGLSAASTSAQSSQQDQGFDLSDLMGMFGGGSQSSSGLGGLLSGLFGGGSAPDTDSASDGTDLLNTLVGFLK